ncbi:MAG: SulP family inorganic anion transporter [Anaerolineales bacterium]|jgi:SulP family sulfate permease
MKNFFNRKTLGSDLIAGLTLGIESVPDGMASGLLAAVNPIHGIYGYMVGTFTGAFVTSSVYMAVQAPSAMALIVAGVPSVHGDENALESLVALTILTGIFVALMGLLKFGRFLRFVSNSVMVGFVTGVGVLTILGQLDNLTAYTSEGANRLVKTWDLIRHMDQIDMQTLFVGIVTIMLILSLEKTRLKSLGLVVAIFLASLLPAIFNWDSVAVVADIAEIPSELPRPVLPPLSIFPALIVPAISLALVALVQGSGVSKAYANPDGQFPDVDRDFIGQGIANIFSGVFRGIPVSGSFSATALSVDSGAKTRFALVFAGITMAVVLLVFGDAISYLAMPALAGLLIVIGYRIIKLDDVRVVWRLGLYHETVMVFTFALTLVIPLQYAVFAGGALSILMYVTRQSNRIKLVEWVRQPGDLPIEQDAPEEVPPDKATVLIPYGSLFYAAAQAFEEALPGVTEETDHAVVIISLRQRDDLGSTIFAVLERYADNLRGRNSLLMLAEVSDKTMAQYDSTGHIDIFGRDNLFRSTERPYESLQEALHQAEKWIAEQK